MKIRHGFVSNSSSSSFVIVCDPENFELFVDSLGREMKTLKEPVYQSVHYICENDDYVPTREDLDDELCYLQHDYEKVIPVTWEEVLRQLYSSVIKVHSCPDIDAVVRKLHLPRYDSSYYDDRIFISVGTGEYQCHDYRELPGIRQLEECDRDSRESSQMMTLRESLYTANHMATILAIDYMFKMHPEYKVYVIEYSDNDSPWDSYMEHADFWKFLNHIRYSNH